MLFYFCARAFQKRKNAVKMRRISGDHFRRICPACRNPAEITRDHARDHANDHSRKTGRPEDRRRNPETGNRLEQIKPEQITGTGRAEKQSNVFRGQPPPLISCGRKKAGKAVKKTPEEIERSHKKSPLRKTGTGYF